MFERLLGDGLRASTPSTCQAGASPRRRRMIRPICITGSPGRRLRAAALDPAALRFHPRSREGSKMVGICFGHQVDGRRRSADRSRKSAKGLGRRPSPLPDRPATSPGWTTPPIAVPASHQDQVVGPAAAHRRHRRPRSSRLMPRSPGPTGRAISFQFHPEFAPAFAKALIEQRYDRVPDPDARASPRSTRPTTMSASAPGSADGISVESEKLA